MSCGDHNIGSGSCVEQILRDIVKAQDEVNRQTNPDTDCCESSCKQSINELLGNSRPSGRQSNRKNTVPIILYCKGDCEPFEGFGSRDADKEIKRSAIFKVKKITRDNCAVLELLLKHHSKGGCTGHGQDKGHGHSNKLTDIKPKDLKASGICITVDLRCFCHVSCLAAIRV